MDPKLLYWTGALLNMGVIVSLAAWGIRARRRGDVALHRRRMLMGALLVVGFVLSYTLKLAVLGREDRGAWSAADRGTLYFHELCVFTMLVAGGVAAWRGRKLGRTRNATGAPADPPAAPTLTTGHRTAGWTAVGAAVLGLLSACLVLAGMYRRAGLF